MEEGAYYLALHFGWGPAQILDLTYRQMGYFSHQGKPRDPDRPEPVQYGSVLELRAARAAARAKEAAGV